MMQIIIPMAGTGKRFKDKGYKKSKYLLEINGKTIIEKIISNFNLNEDIFLFICNKEDFEKNDLVKFFDGLNINYKLVKIDNHKLGPIYTLKKAEKYIKNNLQTIVNYCDFYWKWNYNDFKNRINDYNGGIICYKGFHPHLLRNNFYAGVKTNNKNELIEIKEKYSYTENKMNTWQSSGTYYFKSGELLKNNINELIKKDIKCNGEYYVSLLFNLIKDKGLTTFIYEINYFLQLGTPEDYEECKYWENIFNSTNQHNLFKP